MPEPWYGLGTRDVTCRSRPFYIRNRNTDQQCIPTDQRTGRSLGGWSTHIFLPSIIFRRNHQEMAKEETKGRDGWPSLRESRSLLDSIGFFSIGSHEPSLYVTVVAGMTRGCRHPLVPCFALPSRPHGLGRLFLSLFLSLSNVITFFPLLISCARRTVLSTCGVSSRVYRSRLTTPNYC